MGHVVGFFCFLSLDNITATDGSFILYPVQHEVLNTHTHSLHPQTRSMEFILFPFYQWGN